MKPIGQARTEIEIQDLSVLTTSGLTGIVGVLGSTERGPVNKPTLVGSWLEFTRIFGGLIDDDIFPLLCRRALERGGRLMVSRVAHYTNITDRTTLEGVAASLELGAGNATLTATSIGAWGNDLEVIVTAAANGVANEFDVTINLAGFPDSSEFIQNVPATLTPEAIGEFNSRSTLVYFDAIEATNTIAVLAATNLASGAEDRSLITDIDYIGDPTQGLGINSFDKTSLINKIAVLAKAVPAIDAALVDYADMRKDLRAVVRTPVGLNGTGILDYRNGTGAYSHQPLDSWRADMWTGGLEINHPVTGERIEIPEIGDVVGAMSARDNDYPEWFAVSGPQRGRVRNSLGVVFDLGSAARQATADNVDVNGVNAVIEHPSFGVVLWGNSTLQRQRTLLTHSNVADLLIYLTRELRPLIESELFQPNDPATWKAIHRKVTPLMDAVVDGRGISDYRYDGDQNVDRIQQAVVNKLTDIDQGMYVFNLFIKPISALKYLGVKVALTNSGVDFESLTA